MTSEKCQILFIGNAGVGKTSLISRYANGIFKEEYLSTIGFESCSKEEIIKNKNVRVILWDTAGQERYKALTTNYFKNAEGVALVYDVTKYESFENLKDWIQSIKNNLGDDNNIPIIIIGNKIDMEGIRETKKEDAEKFSKENGYQYFETSCKTGEGVDDAIRNLVEQILNQRDKSDEVIEERNSSMKIERNSHRETQKKKGCC